MDILRQSGSRLGRILRWLSSVLTLWGLLLLIAVSARAQDRVEVRAIGGAALIVLDEPWYAAGGGSFHVGVSSDFQVGGEALYMAGPRDQSVLTIMPVVTWTFRRGPRVQPYLIGGIGWARTRHPIPAGTFETRGWVGNGGVGSKFLLSDRFFIAPEVRIGGDEPIVTITASLGIRF